MRTKSPGPGTRSRCSPAAVLGVISSAASATAAAPEMSMVSCRIASWTRSAKGSVYSFVRRVSAPAHCAWSRCAPVPGQSALLKAECMLHEVVAMIHGFLMGFPPADEARPSAQPWRLTVCMEKYWIMFWTFGSVGSFHSSQ